jgi:RHS repeat-associated protein
MLSGLGVDEYFTRTDAARVHTLLTDALGSTLALTDNAGTVQSAYTYEPYGETTTTGTANPNPFQYTGRENDGTGLYYYCTRYYLPSVQRFISEDPLDFLAGDLNLYAYVGGDPSNYIDPIGTVQKTSFLNNVVNGLLGLQRQSHCGTVNVNAARQLRELDSTITGRKDSPPSDCGSFNGQRATTSHGDAKVVKKP